MKRENKKKTYIIKPIGSRIKTNPNIKSERQEGETQGTTLDLMEL